MSYIDLTKTTSGTLILAGITLFSPVANALTPARGTIELNVDPNGIVRQATPQLSLPKASDLIICLVELEQQSTECFPKNEMGQRNCQNNFSCFINSVTFPDRYFGIILLTEDSAGTNNKIIGSGICSLDAPCILGTTQVKFQVANTPNLTQFNLNNRRLYQYYNQQQSNSKTVAFAQYLINLSQNNSGTLQTQDLYQVILQTIADDIEDNPRFWSNPPANYSSGISSQLCENMPLNSLNYRNCWYNIMLHHHVQRHLRPALENYLYQSLKNSTNSPVSYSLNLQNNLTTLQNNYQELVQLVILPSINQNTIIDDNMRLSLNQSVPLTLQGLYQETVFLTLQKLAQEGEISSSEIAELMTPPSTPTDLNFSRSTTNFQPSDRVPLWNSQQGNPLW